MNLASHHAQPHPTSPASTPSRDTGTDPLRMDPSNFFFGSGEDAFVMLDPFDQWLQGSRPAGYYLYGMPVQGTPGTRVDVRDNKTGEVREGMLNFASYNYLGLSYRAEVKEAVVEAVHRYGNGASGSPVLSGSFEVHQQLTDRVAAFQGTEAALLFPTGYSANLGVISGLMRQSDYIVADQFAHASIVDGMVLSKAKSRFFRHNRPDDLDRKLKGVGGKKLVAIEGVYSMDGDLPALPEIVEVCRRHNARLLLDEAHSAFLFGERGRGVAEHFGLKDEIDLHIGTFSKSLGGQGGYVAGSQKLIEYLRCYSRSRFFSCGLSPVVAAGILAALDVLEREPELRARLWSNVRFAQERLKAHGVDIGDSDSQVVPIMIGDDARIFRIAESLMEEGVFLNPIRYPAVSKGKSRFRMSISASHTEADLEEGIGKIAGVLSHHGAIR